MSEKLKNKNKNIGVYLFYFSYFYKEIAFIIPTYKFRLGGMLRNAQTTHRFR